MIAKPLAPLARLPWLCLLLFLPGCLAGPAIQGSGVAKTEMRDVEPFTEVEASGAVRVELTVGGRTSVEVTADDNLLPLVVTEVADGKLKVYVDGNTSTRLGITVKATTPVLEVYEGSGATTAMVTGVQADDFRLALSGASKCTLNGQAEYFDVSCSGASRADASGLTVERVKAEASGASTVEVWAKKEVKASASGASTIRYAGTPEKVENATSGASTVGPK